MSPFLFLKNIPDILSKVCTAIWGTELILLLCFTGIFLSFKTKFIQIRRFKSSFSLSFKGSSNKNGISPFASLCTTLSSTIGTGNIIGVASAICIGGPGTVLWMLIAAFLGMPIKYAEGFLAVKYKKRERFTGNWGGPFFYIENGLGKKFKPLAVAFAIFGTLTGILGIGTMVQSNSISLSIDIISKNSQNTKIISSFILTLICAIIIFGGIKRISKVSEFLVPIMSIIYLSFSLFIILRNYTKIPYALKTILVSALYPKSILGATTGITFKSILKTGFSKGMFSNESGLGSSPIAVAASSSDNPDEQGLVAMLGTFIDTFVICSVTGLTVTLTGIYSSDSSGMDAICSSWKAGLPFSSDISIFILMLCLILFAFTTVIGWNYYSEKCLKYLFLNSKHKHSAILIFKISYIFAVFIGCFISSGTVWIMADICNGLMALPNLMALIMLSNQLTHKNSKEKRD